MPKWLGVLCVILFVIPCQALETGETPQTVQLQSTLPNGLRVVVQSTPWERLTHVEVFYCAGSATEPDSLAGLAHLAEHLMMDSSPQHPGGELGRLQTLYTTFSNAYTGSSSMRFVGQCLPEFLPQVLELEADRMHGAMTDPVCFERQKRVVMEELAFRNRLSPHQEFMVSLFQSAFPGHPFGRNIGGSSASVGRIKSDDFFEFQQKCIQPQRAVLVISGAGDAEAVMAMVSEIFAFGDHAEPYISQFPQYPEVSPSQIIQDATDHSGLKIAFACRIPLENTKDAIIADSLSEFFDDAWFGINIWPVPGEVVFMASCSGSYIRPSTAFEELYYPDLNPDQDALSGLGALWEGLGEKLDDLSQRGPFNTARRRVMDQQMRQKHASSTGRRIGSALINGNQAIDQETVIQTLNNLQPMDLQDFANKYLHPGRAVVGISHGKDSGRSATINLAKRVPPQATLNVTEDTGLLAQELIDPVLETYQKTKLIQIEKTSLPNGIPVYYLVLPEAKRWYLGGHRTLPWLKDLRPSKKAGLDRFYNAVVNYDFNQKKNPDEYEAPRSLPFDMIIDLKPWQIDFTVNGNSTQAAKIAAALDHRLKNNSFNTSRWGQIIRWGKRLLQITNSRQDNAARAWRWGKLLGDNHPALSPYAPNPATASSVKYRDLEKLHDKVAGKVGNTIIAAAGPIDSLKIGEIFRGKFWPDQKWKSNPDFPQTDGKIAGVQGKVFPDLQKGDVQLFVSFGPIKAQRSNEISGTTAFLFQEALHQSLNMQLRETEGLTYTTACSVRSIGSMIMLETGLSCQPGQAHLALASLRRILNHHAKEGFSLQEISQAKLSQTAQAIADYSDPEKGRNALLALAAFGEIPSDPMASIFGVKPEQINAMAKDFLDTENFVFTAIGPMFEEDIDQFTLKTKESEK